MDILAMLDKLILPLGQPAGRQQVVAIEAHVESKALQLAEDIETNDVATFRSIERAHSHIKVSVVLLDPWGASEVEKGLSGVNDDLSVGCLHLDIV